MSTVVHRGKDRRCSRHLLRKSKRISFFAPSEDRMSIAVSGDGLTSSEDEGAAGLPPSGVVCPPQ